MVFNRVTDRTMTKDDYFAARRLIRDNGYFALQWLPETHGAVMERLRDQAQAKDVIADRAYWYKRMDWSIHLAKVLALSAPPTSKRCALIARIRSRAAWCHA
jgi:hypothetical protein